MKMGFGIDWPDPVMFEGGMCLRSDLISPALFLNT